MSNPSEITPSAEPAAPAAAPDRKIMIAALGGCGAKTLNAFARLPGCGSFQTLLLETDKESAAHCTASAVLRAEVNWAANTGLGCGGDPKKAERAFSRKRNEITQALSGQDFIIVTGGLGGGTATGGVRAVASVIRSLSIPAVFMLTTPFSFESYTKRSNAEQCLQDLHGIVEVLVPLPNDLLFSSLPPDTEVEPAFEKAAFELASSIFGIAELFRSRKLIGPDYAEFSAALTKAANTCSFGCGRASQKDGLDRCAIALERMLESPFLGGMDRLTGCSALIVSMTGGDLQFGEMKRTLENLVSFLPVGIPVSAGATINPEYHDQVQLCALAVQYVQTVRPAESQVPSHDSLFPGENKNSFEQGLLNLQSYSKGIFSNCPPVKYKDEDLDIPTFQRRGVSIDKGGTSR